VQKKITALFEKALQKKSALGIDHLFFSGLVRSKRGVALFQGELDSVEIADEIKLGVWLKSEGRWGCSSLEEVSEGSLERALSQALQASQFSDPDPEYSLAPAAASKDPYNPDPNIPRFSPQFSMEEFERIGRSMEEQARQSSSLITNIPEVSVGHDSFARILVNSEGARVVETNHLLKAGISVMASGEDKRIVNVHEMEYWRTRDAFQPEELVSEVTEEVRARLSPRIPASGSWPILFDPRTAAQLLATFWGIFSGDLLYRKLTRLEGKLGQEIASRQVSLFETGSGEKASALMPHHFDAEGTPTQDKFILEQGTFRTFLHNRYTARKAQTQTTGNAAGGLGEIPGVSPSNIRWEGTLSPLSDLLSSMNRGILVKELHGASASPISGDFSYGTLGYWVENGRVQYPIADFTIAGNFFDLLKKVGGLGDDLRFFSPHMLGSYGGRSLLVEALAVSGN